MLDVDQAGELKAAFRRTRGSDKSVWTNEHIKALSNGAFLGKVLDVLNGRSRIVPVEKKSFSKAVDSIIRVDRTKRRSYPERWSLLYPELQDIGPAEYPVSKVQQWCHEKQSDGAVDGSVILDCIKAEDDLMNHLELADLIAIKKKKIVFYREHFAGKKLFGWRSATVSGDGHKSIRVPYLYEYGNVVTLGWRYTSEKWDVNCPALRLLG